MQMFDTRLDDLDSIPSLKRLCAMHGNNVYVSNYLLQSVINAATLKYLGITIIIQK